jgi:hypothetical protein
MNASPSRWRRLAVKLAQHAASVLPGARSPWADAMRHELDYIGDDSVAVRWALGCIAASYRARLAQWLSVRPSWRQVATSGALMILIGLALQENAGGQTPLPRLACDEPGSPQMSSKLDSGTNFRPAERTDTLEHHPETCEAISEKVMREKQGPRR